MWYAGTITSSPLPIPRTLSVISKAAVQEFNATVLELPTKLVISFSNCFVLGPVVIHPDLSTSTTLSMSVWLIAGGENGIFFSHNFTPFL